MLQYVVIEQPGALVFRHARRERMEQSVEVIVGFSTMPDAEQLFHVVPQRVRIQHESRPRHDIGPIAGLVLL